MRARKGLTGGGLFVMKTRKQRIEFHIKSNDYFGTMATLIDLARQSFEKDKNITPLGKRQIKNLENLKNDLVFLQKNYQITKK